MFINFIYPRHHRQVEITLSFQLATAPLQMVDGDKVKSEQDRSLNKFKGVETASNVGCRFSISDTAIPNCQWQPIVNEQPGNVNWQHEKCKSEAA